MKNQEVTKQDTITEMAAGVASELRPQGKRNYNEWEEYGIAVAVEVYKRMNQPTSELVSIIKQLGAAIEEGDPGTISNVLLTVAYPAIAKVDNGELPNPYTNGNKLAPVVTCLTIDDLIKAGYETADVHEGALASIAEYMGEKITELNFWDSLDWAAEQMDLVKKEEVDED